MLRTAAIVGIAATAVSACSPRADQAADERDLRDYAGDIARIESGLAPRFVAKGEPRPSWTIEERMRHYHVPGVSVAVMVDGRLAWAKGYGVLDREAAAKVDADTMFQAASLSKPVAGLGVLRLVEQGVLSLDAPVNDYLKSWQIPENEFTAEVPVTLRQLLSHRAGATVHGFPGYAADAPVPTTVEVLAGMPPANTDPVVIDTRPGDAYRYSGGGFTIAQLAVEEVTGERFGDFISREVLAPAGMSRSRYDLPAKGENAARAHTGRYAEPLAGHSHVYPEQAAAGLWTTASDLLRLSLKVIESRSGADSTFLGRASAETIVPGDENAHGLGFGLTRNGDGLVFSHGGANEGYRARWFAYADGRGGAAVMTNSDSGGGLIREILAIVGDTYGWAHDALTERDVVPLELEWMEALAGDYSFSPNDRQAALVVELDDGLWIEGLFLPRTRLYPESKTSFFVAEGYELEVETDEEGVPAAFNVQNELRLVRVE